MSFQSSNIDATHGVVSGLSSEYFAHRNLLEVDQFAAYLEQRERPYVSLAASLKGGGDALTIDDSTVAAADAARIARKYGHEVTLFLNGYNIVRAQPYCFSLLNLALDATRTATVMFEGTRYVLHTTVAKRTFRKVIKQRLARLGTEVDRQELVGKIVDLIGIDKITVPSYLCPITLNDLNELVSIGVDIQNHGWTHARIGSLPPDEYADDIRRGRQWLETQWGGKSDFFAVPNGDGFPLWKTSPHYRIWMMLDANWPPGNVIPGVFNRRMLALSAKAQ